MTHHGQDYNRAKWGKFARRVLKTGERLGVKYSHAVIAISEGIKNSIRKLYGRNDTLLLPNGVIIHEKTNDSDYIGSLGIKGQKFIIAVGRFVPEKGFHDLIEAYRLFKIRSSGLGESIKIVIAGDADYETPYSMRLKQLARDNRVILTGFITWQLLRQLYSHTILFVLPSYHEGTSMALLEALSFGIDVLTSDISANMEVGLDRDSYFRVGNIPDLSENIGRKLTTSSSKNYFDLLERKYNWENVASGMYSVFSELSKKK